MSIAQSLVLLPFYKAVSYCPYNIVFQKTNGKLNQLAYKVNIRILNPPQYIKEGLSVKVLFLEEKVSLFNYVLKKVNYFGFKYF